jgi:hypothetical protein
MRQMTAVEANWCGVEARRTLRIVLASLACLMVGLPIARASDLYNITVISKGVAEDGDWVPTWTGLGINDAGMVTWSASRPLKNQSTPPAFSTSIGGFD